MVCVEASRCEGKWRRSHNLNSVFGCQVKNLKHYGTFLILSRCYASVCEPFGFIASRVLEDFFFLFPGILLQHKMNWIEKKWKYPHQAFQKTCIIHTVLAVHLPFFVAFFRRSAALFHLFKFNPNLNMERLKLKKKNAKRMLYAMKENWSLHWLLKQRTEDWSHSNTNSSSY